MEAADEEPVRAAFSDEYYFNLLADLENITAPKVPTMFTLPDESIWNTLDLTSLAKKTASTSKKGKTSSFERDIQRINASTAVSVPTAAKRSHTSRIIAHCVPLTNKERYVCFICIIKSQNLL
jgi:hypothetical protein